MLTEPSLVQTLVQHKSDVNWCVFKGKSMATCSADKTVRLWRIKPDNQIEEDHTVSPLTGHTYYVHCCQFSPCGRILASSSTDGRVIFWDVKTGKQLHELSHESGVCLKICRFSPDGYQLLTGSDDETLALWDVNPVFAMLETKPVAKQLCSKMRSFVGHEGSIFAADFSPDGEIIVSGCSVGELRFWDAKYGHDPPLLELDAAHDLGVTASVFCPIKAITPENKVRFQDPKRPCHISGHVVLATAGNCNTVKLWRVSTILEFDVSPMCTLSVHTSSVSSVAFSPNGQILASASTDKSLALWNVTDGTLIKHWECHSRYLTSCAFYQANFNDASLLLATGSNDKSIKLWYLKFDLSGDKADHSAKISSEDVTTLSNQPEKEEIILPLMNLGTCKTKVRVSEWSIDQVCDWLKTVLDLQEYCESFQSNAIDGQELVNIDNRSLIDIGVKALGHRNKIIRGVQKVVAHPYLAFQSEVETPDEYLCPITHEVMTDPIIAADGYTYERIAMEAWLKSGKVISPMTNAPLASLTLTPNRSLKLLIERFQN